MLFLRIWTFVQVPIYEAVATILIDSIRVWVGILRGTRAADVHESPFVMSHLRPEELLLRIEAVGDFLRRAIALQEAALTDAEAAFGAAGGDGGQQNRQSGGCGVLL